MVNTGQIDSRYGLEGKPIDYNTFERKRRNQKYAYISLREDLRLEYIVSLMEQY